MAEVVKTVIITVPIDRIDAVRKYLDNWEIGKKQTPVVKVRVAASDVEKIREIIYRK